MNQPPVRLIPLLCVRCSFPVPAQPDEVAWSCPQCGQGQILDDRVGLRPLDVFFSGGLRQGQPGRPYWVAPGQVIISQRQTYKGNETRAAEVFWAGERLFFVPAWDASLNDLIALGVLRLQTAAQMQPGSPAPFLPAVTLPADMQPLCEFMVASIEAGRKDALMRIHFTLTLKPPQLWVLPD